MSLEWAPWCEYMNIAECNRKRDKGCQKAKMIILAKEGSLRGACEYESISLDPAEYNTGKLPYFAKISKIRESIFRAEGICTRKTYLIWRNITYKVGYTATMIGESRRHLVTSELESVG